MTIHSPEIVKSDIISMSIDGLKYVPGFIDEPAQVDLLAESDLRRC
jgi:hypothetical protein